MANWPTVPPLNLFKYYCIESVINSAHSGKCFNKCWIHSMYWLELWLSILKINCPKHLLQIQQSPSYLDHPPSNSVWIQTKNFLHASVSEALHDPLFCQKAARQELFWPEMGWDGLEIDPWAAWHYIVMTSWQAWSYKSLWLLLLLELFWPHIFCEFLISVCFRFFKQAR